MKLYVYSYIDNYIAIMEGFTMHNHAVKIQDNRDSTFESIFEVFQILGILHVKY